MINQFQAGVIRRFLHVSSWVCANPIALVITFRSSNTHYSMISLNNSVAVSSVQLRIREVSSTTDCDWPIHVNVVLGQALVRTNASADPSSQCTSSHRPPKRLELAIGRCSFEATQVWSNHRRRPTCLTVQAWVSSLPETRQPTGMVDWGTSSPGIDRSSHG